MPVVSGAARAGNDATCTTNEECDAIKMRYVQLPGTKNNDYIYWVVY